MYIQLDSSHKLLAPHPPTFVPLLNPSPKPRPKGAAPAPSLDLGRRSVCPETW